MPAAGGAVIEEPAAFGELDFGSEPLEIPAPPEVPAAAPALAQARPGARAHTPAVDAAPVPPPVAETPDSTTGGIAYITVTDAAGRVLFRRAATPSEVADALRSADAAQAEGEAAMDRISYDRLFRELNSGAPPDPNVRETSA